VGQTLCIQVLINDDSGKKQQSVGRSVNELVEAMYPVLQSIDLAIEVLGDEDQVSVKDPLWVYLNVTSFMLADFISHVHMNINLNTAP